MVATKKKTPQHTTEIKPLTNKRSWIDFINEDAYMLFPEKNDWRKRFICTLLEWASQENSLEITDFALEMKMRRMTIYDWAKKHPDIKSALDQARLMIGTRRRKGALTRKFDKDVAFRDMHCYDPEWLEINKYHADLKKEEERQSHTFIINDVKPRIVSKEELSQEE